MSRLRKGQESGFALLFVLAAAAIIGIMLYLELPRVAFEAQRTKEGDLIAAGEQYKRAIKLFVNRFNRYPSAISDLENTNNMRFLRRRYKDPMTGKDDWRLIHVAGGTFTDSLTQKPPTPKGTTDATDLGSSSTSTSDSSPAEPPPLQRWQIVRPGPSGSPKSSIISADAGTTGGQADLSQQLGVPVAPGSVPPQGQFNSGDTVPGVTQPSALQPGQPGYAPMQADPNQTGQPGMQQPGQNPYRPGAPNQPLYPPVPLPGMPPNAGSNPALSTSNSPLTGGSSPLGSSSSPGMFGSTGTGAGIGGVASKAELVGIKTYNDHKKYNEWEFLYDPRKDMATPGAAQAQAPPGTALGTQLGTPLGTPGGVQTGMQPGMQPGSQPAAAATPSPQ
jgi:type II secretory pathway pseudopilin PulG